MYLSESQVIERTRRYESRLTYSIEAYGEVKGPGTDWNTYQLTHAFWGLPLSNGIHRMIVTFVQGQVNLCSISVTTSFVSTLSVTEADDSLLEKDEAKYKISIVDIADDEPLIEE
jgi:hypothetical protein